MQKQFLANTEDAIQSSVDLPSQITRYQNALKYARTKVDYVFGFGLYMAPSNMELRIGTIQGYNNKIILSTGSDPQDTITWTKKSVADQPTLETPKSTAETHENNKTALILGSIIVGSVALIIYEIY